MKDPACMYCEPNETLHNLMTYICEVEGHKLYFFKNQSYAGRCILAYKDHVRCVDELSEADCGAYFAAVNRVTKALKSLYNPHQINIGTFGDTAGHIHCHIVPKYEGGLDFGKMFQMMPETTVTLTEDETTGAIEKIKAALA